MTEPTAPRLLLTDAAVARQPFAEDKPRILRDSKIPGFHLWVGKKTKTYRYQYELPSDNGRRGRTQIEVLGEHPHVEADEVRAKVLAFQLRRARGEPVREPKAQEAPEPRLLSFGEAWALYRAAITKEGRSERTIADYQDKFDRHLSGWHQRPLASLTREDVTKEHAAITERARKLRAGQKYVSGKYAANGCMRFARAVWNFAKDELETLGLPERNPFRSGKLFHKEKARKTGMSPEVLPAWWRQVQALDNPIRREMHLFTLLSGLRKTDILTAQWGHVNWDKRSLRLPNPKGGDERAFELPLSQPMMDCLKRVKELGQTFYPEHSKIWVFPTDCGHIAEVKEDGRHKVSHTGHALRHSFRTLAGAAGIDRLRTKILMNHALDRDVTDSYANVPALFSSLMDAQEAISKLITSHLHMMERADRSGEGHG